MLVLLVSCWVLVLLLLLVWLLVLLVSCWVRSQSHSATRLPSSPHKLAPRLRGGNARAAAQKDSQEECSSASYN